MMANKKEKPVIKFSENDIQKKLYGDIKSTKAKKEAQVSEKDLWLAEKKSQGNIQEEIEALKNEISKLEEKLTKTEQQKEHLKKKLVQKRKIGHLKENILSFFLSKTAKNFLIIVLGLIVIFSFALFLATRQKPTPAAPKEKIKPEQVVEQTPLKKKEVIIEKKETQLSEQKIYTLQAAEFTNKVAAERFVKNLEAQGFLVIVQNFYRDQDKNRPYYKINVGSFTSFEEAKIFKEEFQRITGIKDTFIKEKK